MVGEIHLQGRDGDVALRGDMKIGVMRLVFGGPSTAKQWWQWCGCSSSSLGRSEWVWQCGACGVSGGNRSGGIGISGSRSGVVVAVVVVVVVVGLPGLPA